MATNPLKTLIDNLLVALNASPDVTNAARCYKGEQAVIPAGVANAVQVEPDEQVESARGIGGDYRDELAVRVLVDANLRDTEANIDDFLDLVQAVRAAVALDDRQLGVTVEELILGDIAYARYQRNDETLWRRATMPCRALLNQE